MPTFNDLNGPFRKHYRKRKTFLITFFFPFPTMFSTFLHFVKQFSIFHMYLFSSLQILLMWTGLKFSLLVHL